jgi:hypothetical protein
VKDLLEELVASTAWPVYSPGAKKYYGEGKAEGLAEGVANGEREALVVVLRARGLKLTEEQRDLITACTDADQLTTWVTRAATAAKAADIFD